MGLSPHEVKGLSIFEYLAALDGYSEANDQESHKKLSEAEKDEIWAQL